MNHGKSNLLNNLAITVGSIFMFSLSVSIFIIKLNVQKSTLPYDHQVFFLTFKQFAYRWWKRQAKVDLLHGLFILK